MTDFFENNGMDLGNDANAGFGDFPAFDSPATRVPFTEEIPTFDVPQENTTASTMAQESIEGNTVKDNSTTEPQAVPSAETVIPESGTQAEMPDFFQQAISKSEEIDAQNKANAMADKLPIFSYTNVKEEIVDTSKTFDELRIEKSEDFAQLDDESAVTWKVIYGSISKEVPDPKNPSIAAFKKKIEESKPFAAAVKKAKGDIKCTVTPIVKTKSKGVGAVYKDAFLSLNDAQNSGKVISFVPSDDGLVYELRKNDIGTFIAPAKNVTILNKVRAGFTPALPKIPYVVLEQIISFFKSLVTDEYEYEALAFIYWSKKENQYQAYVPLQYVSKDSVNSILPDIDEDEYILVMEIHSHNTMEAVFSYKDNNDEKETRLYTVIGKLDHFFPSIKTRCSVNGNFIELNPSEVFEERSCNYPCLWDKAIKPEVRI